MGIWMEINICLFSEIECVLAGRWINTGGRGTRPSGGRVLRWPSASTLHVFSDCGRLFMALLPDGQDDDLESVQLDISGT